MKARAARMLFRTGLTRRASAFEGLPHPNDSPKIVIEGENPHRILLLGGGIMVGTGVLSHELGIGGHLARALHTITGRGVQLQIVPVPGISISDAASYLLSEPLQTFDAVVIAVGLNDSLIGTPTKRWTQRLTKLIDATLTQLPDGGTLYLLEIADPSKSPLFRRSLARSAAHRARRLNAASHTIIDSIDHVTMLRFVIEPTPDQSSLYDSSAYRAWAGQLAPGIAQRLT